MKVAVEGKAAGVSVYAGIGSRLTPHDVAWLMTEFALTAARAGWTLRTGGGGEADQSFLAGALLWIAEVERSPREGYSAYKAGERGQVDAHELRAIYELYLPWPGFSTQAPPTLDRPAPLAYEIAGALHPAWPNCSAAARRLHARNAHVALGRELTSPVDRVVCWTPKGTLDGAEPGGTASTLRIVAEHCPGAEVWNLARPEHRALVEAFAGVKA